jgi:hypothetical protein
LVRDQTDNACREEEQNHDDDDQIDGMRKQTTSSPQRPDDRFTAMILPLLGAKREREQ